MKGFNRILFIIICFSVSGLSAQPALDSLLKAVEENNPELMTQKQLMEARKLEFSSGLTPDNPEIEFAYLWGKPDELGNRVDFAVTQSFDFPTVYTSRSRLSEINREQVHLEYLVRRQEIMLSAHEIWIQGVYLNKVGSMLSERLQYARKVVSAFKRKLETGDGNQLELNQARLKVISLENEISLLQQRLSQNNTDAKNLTGERDFEIRDTLLPASKPLILDTLLIRFREGHMNKYYQTEVQKKSKEVDVVFNSKLPRLKAGYYRETILNTQLQGIQAGISIPLWENARAVKTAKAQLVFAQSNAEWHRDKKENEIRKIYEQWTLLKNRISGIERILKDSNDEDLLRKAMESGEISLVQYFYESDFYFQNLLTMLEFRKEMLMLEAQLLKVYY